MGFHNHSTEDRKAILVRWYIGVLCCSIVLYAISCAPGALWQDSGLIQYRIWHNDIEGFLGLAISHPLFYILAIVVKYIPLSEFGYRVNLVSAVAAAVAVANMFLLVRLWLGKNFPALIAAVTLAVSHTFWCHASIIETYTLWTAFFLVELIMLLQYTRTKKVKYLYWLGLANGLAVSVHMLASIPLICYVVFLLTLLVKREIRAKDLLIVAFLWFIGTLPYEFLVVKNIIQTGDVAATLSSAAFGRRWQGAVLNTSISARLATENLLFIALNFPTPNALLFFVGCFGLFKVAPSVSFRNVFLGLIVLFFVFAFRYTIVDRYAFFIPFYCMVSIFVGLGTHYFQTRVNCRICTYLVLLFSLLPICIYAVAPTSAERKQINVGTRGDIPYRNDYEYFLQPWKTGYRGAERFANEALDVVEDGAIIYADSTTVAPLLYVQEVNGKRPDVKIVSSVVNSQDAPAFNAQTIRQLMESKAVYVVSRIARYCPAFLLEEYDLVQTGVLWRVVARPKL
jgi:hypothetical protein